jgi:hypothetical protein
MKELSTQPIMTKNYTFNWKNPCSVNALLNKFSVFNWKNEDVREDL